MKDKLNRFMQGRYGVDNFARFTLGVALFVIVVGSFMRQNAAGGVLDTVGFILIIYTYFRILSRNISARYAENQKYLGYTWYGSPSQDKICPWHPGGWPGGPSPGHSACGRPAPAPPPQNRGPRTRPGPR